MAELYDDSKFSNIEVATNLGLTLSGTAPRIKHTGSGTLAVSSAGPMTIESANTTSGVTIGATTDMPVTLASGGGTLTLGASSTTASFSGDVAIAGNLTVSGDTVSHDVVTIQTEDPIMRLNEGTTGTNSNDIGFVGDRGDANNIGFFWDESADQFACTLLGDDADLSTAVISTITDYADLRIGGATIDDAATVGSTLGVIGDLSVNTNKFTVTASTGATTIAGNAKGTDAFTVTAGDILVTSGHLDMTTGDLTLSDGSVTITDADDAASLSVTNNTITTGGNIVDITSTSLTTGNAINVVTNALTTGSMVYLETSTTGMTGEYIRCYDGAADDFVVGANGDTTIAGSLTVTGENIDLDPTGNFTLDMDASGTITITTDDADNAMVVQAAGGEDLIALSYSVGTKNISLGNATDNPTLQQLGSGQVTFSGNVDATNGLDVTTTALTTAAGITNSGGEVLVSGGNMQINDDIVLSFGDSDDVTIAWEDATSNFDIDNTLATGTTRMILGTDTSATAFQVNNNTETPLLTIDGSGQATFSGNVDATNGLDVTTTALTTAAGITNSGGEILVSGGNMQINDDIVMSFGDSDDVTIAWEDATSNFDIDNTLATGTTRMILGTDTSATAFQVNNNTETPLLTIDGSGQATFSGNVDATNGLDVTTTALTTAAGITNSGGEVLVSGGNMQINDDIVLSFGDSDDVTIAWENATSNFDIDNTATSGTTRMVLGTDTSATALHVINNSETTLLSIDGTGATTFQSSIADANLTVNYTGTFTGVGRSMLISGDVTNAEGSNCYGLDVDPTGITTSGSTTLVCSLRVDEPVITVSSGSVTTAATVYVEAAPTEASTNYALWIDDGLSKFDGNVTVDGILACNNNLWLKDNDNLYIGGGNDFSIVHDSTDTTMTSTTGDLIVDNTNTTGSSIMRLGTDTTATDFQIQNNSESALFTVDGSGEGVLTGGLIHRRKVETVTASTDVLTAAQSGTYLFADTSSNAITFTLPAVSAGLFYRIIVADGTNNLIVQSNSGSDVIHALYHTGTSLARSEDRDQITFSGTRNEIGDWMEFTCDGTKWYMTGVAHHVDTITTAQS